MVQQALERFFLLVPAVGVEIKRDFAVGGMRRFPVSDRLEDRFDPGFVALKHFLLRAGPADLDLHEEITLIDGFDDLIERYVVRKQRHVGNFRVTIAQGLAKFLGNHLIEGAESVLGGEKHPRGVV